MSRIRSPGYPSINIEEAIDYADRIYQENRTNATHREAAVRDMGYKGLTGQSAKLLADLAHYALIEKAGKGGLRVSEAATRIIAPANDKEKADALAFCAYSPELFGEIKEQWPDGFVSNNSLKNWLVRKGFAASAVPTAMKAYEETYGFVRKFGGTESHHQDALKGQESAASEDDDTLGKARAERDDQPMLPPPPPPPLRNGVEITAGERVVFIEESATSQYLKLVASGEIDADMLEALEDFVKRQKKRLARGQPLRSLPEPE